MMEFKSYLHHILPPLSIVIIVGSIIEISVFLLQVDAALAASLSDLAVCSNHVAETKDGEGDRNRNHEVVGDGPGQARLLLANNKLELNVWLMTQYLFCTCC